MEELFFGHRSGHTLGLASDGTLVSVGEYDAERRLSEVWRLGPETEPRLLRCVF